MHIEDEAIQILTKEIVKAIKAMINKSQFDKTVKGKVVSHIGNNKYSVLIDGNEYIAVYRDSSLEANDIVYITVAQNNYNNLFINMLISRSQQAET